MGDEAFNFLHDVRVMIFVRIIKKSVEGSRSFQEFIPVEVSLHQNVGVFVHKGMDRPFFIVHHSDQIKVMTSEFIYSCGPFLQAQVVFRNSIIT